MNLYRRGLGLLTMALALGAAAQHDTQGIPLNESPKVEYRLNKTGGGGKFGRGRRKAEKSKLDKKRKHLRRITNRSRAINRT